MYSYIRPVNRDQNFYEAFEKHVPKGAVNYCFDIWKEDPFNFYITKERNTKLGDFRYRRDKKVQTITINHNLNPYQFLITYVHEVAHYRAFTKFGLSIKPHGLEWKKYFQELMEPLLDVSIFPRDVLIPLKRHMMNPKASSGADFFLMVELRKFDRSEKSDELQYLQQVKKGTQFEIQGRLFEKLETRRTRVLCLEVNSGKKYLISSHAEVKIKN
nr:SprT-like domain-containing protein [Belliella baltica]